MKLGTGHDTAGQVHKRGLVIKLATKLVIISITAAIFLFHTAVTQFAAGSNPPCDSI